MALDRDTFFRSLLRHLAGVLQDVVGLDEAAGFISVVGQRMGEEIGKEYREAMKLPVLSRGMVGDVLVDLKARIGGDFRVVEQDDERIILENGACPFGDKVLDRPALCMMTSNVFGAIVAEDVGYARVAIEKAIARGDGGCRVVVHLVPGDEGPLGPHTREYFRTGILAV